MMKIKAQGIKLGAVILIAEITFILIFAFLGDYDLSSLPDNPGDTSVHLTYPMFQDVHVMMFVGFGFLMTFLKRYGYSSVGVNMLVAAFVLQLALIVRGFIHYDIIGGQRFQVTIGEMLSADFAAAAVLISFGAVLGKVSSLQLLIMATIEVILAQLNEYIGLHKLHASDMGESMYVHVFGAYFGLSVARVLYNEHVHGSRKEGPVYHSDIFSMIGTVFLWMYWPSFNAGAAEGHEQMRAVVNTYLSLSACAIMTFALSALLDKNGRLDMVHIQNATLAGGVAMGTAADMPVHPWGALLIGSVAAIISVLGFKFLTPLLSSRLKLHDTCGVNNLHGMPGLLAGISAAVMGALSSPDTWGDSMCKIFPAREGCGDNSTDLNRSALEQGGYQMAALSVTLAIAIGGGILTGFILKIPFLDAPERDMLFDDQHSWNVAEQQFPDVLVESEGKHEKNSMTYM
ncbi:hypothetical protein C0Q70_12621 [Pomacea canaliculata]|uniref:Ammonium transporter AmtB-like domain-containing protein n=1 Tax=Pomacea canaliculata TaxID=400727 RepID=A0A2T7P217_POMCA|nr:hypothetical protein C0Q70_12621 [Pomacea canaliculata]